ncbi:origin recognition complex subunit 5 C-terminus-domain-containing protein [Schizophyllum amplum]|uniref:Origin recognition complex subunit 5 C-terminus-domain-containing protein n=1 Tax=Schizophyllum amplum TaxID=97359 RepID=A0A550CZY1_9AGAR|nr:origin recognition complex subunit 5 C-terminus-domain-containing protein [Auriculariopsis ampla]
MASTVTAEVASSMITQEENLIQLETLLSCDPAPPFIFVNYPVASRTVSIQTRYVLQKLASEDANMRYASVNAIACFTPRLLFDAIINDLADWTPEWDDGCACWGDTKWGDNLDGFVHGLQTFSAAQTASSPKLIIAIEHAERLPANLLVPFSQLAQLSRLNLTVLMMSDVRWEDLRPSLASAIDAYYIDVAPPSKEAVCQQLIESFPSEDMDTDAPPTPYHPALRTLYASFATMLCDVCFPFTHDVAELQYIAAARWPGVAQPVLDEHVASGEGELLPPDEDTVRRLTARSNTSVAQALDVLLPRKTTAHAWAEAQEHPKGHGQGNAEPSPMPLAELPRMSKFLLVAAFVASSNPARSDLRMFGRGLDERRSRRRPRKMNGAKGGLAKVPLQLAGPAAFPLDRMLAILGALLEEYDADNRPPAPQYQIPGEYTDAEVGRVAVYTAITQLTKIRLLDRTTPADRLDGPPMFKARITHEMALELAKQLSLPLNDLLYEQM